MKNTIKMFGADWCSDCRRAKNFLKENNIAYEFVDVDLESWRKKFLEKIELEY